MEETLMHDTLVGDEVVVKEIYERTYLGECEYPLKCRYTVCINKDFYKWKAWYEKNAIRSEATQYLPLSTDNMVKLAGAFSATIHNTECFKNPYAKCAAARRKKMKFFTRDEIG